MIGGPFDPHWRIGVWFLALIVLPWLYLTARRRLRAAGLASPPQFELFVAFGTFGGWLLCFSTVGVPLVIPLCVGFQLLVAIPTSLFCVARLASRPSPSRFHASLLLALAAGVLVPFAAGALVSIFAPSS